MAGISRRFYERLSIRPPRPDFLGDAARELECFMQNAAANSSGELVEHYRGDYVISTDRARVDLHAVHNFLTNCYWAKGISRELVARSIEHSLCFGLYRGEAQIGFARVISDYATVAYIGDVFVLETHRGQGLSKWMMECIVEHPLLQNLRRWILLTRDAHGLYSKFGFTTLAKPERYMELHRPDVYAWRSEMK
jgi:GNAT superfamily N-acetyltransferase